LHACSEERGRLRSSGSTRAGRHSGEVVSYLHRAGYDVIPVRPDRAPVDRLPTYARLEDVARPVDVVVIFRRPDAVAAHIPEAVAKRAEAVWLPPGAWSREAEDEALRHQLAVVKNRCIVEDHRHLFGPDGGRAQGIRKRPACISAGGHARSKTTGCVRTMTATWRAAPACSPVRPARPVRRVEGPD
jgi:predicted CoA-binding protein